MAMAKPRRSSSWLRRLRIFVGLVLAFTLVLLRWDSLEETKAPPKRHNATLATPINSSDTICNKTERHRIIQRAQRWLDANVHYNFSAFHEGYRTQCSGFLAAAWNLPNPRPERTPRCYNLEARRLARVIAKDQLQMGDALVCNSFKYDPWKNDRRRPGQQGGGHCLLFEGWADASRTAYVGWELCYDANCRDVTRREILYPYFYKTSCWEPMRRYDLNDNC